MSSKVCLNMIVKNEAHVIRRCLDSVRPFIDHWVIVDTGTTDGTQEIMRAHLNDIPGALYERPWRNFGYNRSEAIELAQGKADYILIMDADNLFCALDGWRWPDLTADGYHVTHRSSGTEYEMCVLVADRLPWRYVGVLHEYLTSNSPHRIERLSGPWIDRRHEGARSRSPDTYRKDAAMLEQALLEEPENARYTFYLAQSWRDANELVRARKAYRRRIAMGGWDEEVWYSRYEVARLSERLGAPAAEVCRAYLDAYQSRPSRAEPLCQLARYHRERNELALAYLFARQSVAITYPSDLLFIDDAVYRWKSLDELGIAAYWAGPLAEGEAAVERLLSEGYLPASERPRIEANRRAYVEKRACP
jgi:glycosyltransferase involved in cell wall biosynthesis